MRALAFLFLIALPLAAHADDVLPHTRPLPQTPVARYDNDALSRILAARKLRCGVITAAEDYSMASTHGNLSAFGAELCRAIAAALLTNSNALVLTGYPDDMHGLHAVQNNKIDILFGVTPDTASALPYDVAFGPTIFFDGQGMMVRRTSGITRPEQLAGKPLCYITGTSQEARMNDWAAATHTTFISHDFQERGEMDAALVTGSCTAITDDVSALAQVRADFHAQQKDFVILPQLIAIDPWAPAMHAGEVRLNAVVTDVFAALITAESSNITAKTPGQTTFFGPTPGIAETLHMPDGWANRAITAVGNYKELYSRTLGAWALDRGPDALWSAGGMQAALGVGGDRTA